MTDKLSERYTIRLPQGEKLKLETVAESLHIPIATLIRMLLNSTHSIDSLLNSLTNDKELSQKLDYLLSDLKG